MTSPTPSMFLSVAQACAAYNCSRSYLYDLLGEGRINAVKRGRRIQILAASADAYFAALPPAKIARSKRTRAAAAGTEAPSV